MGYYVDLINGKTGNKNNDRELFENNNMVNGNESDKDLEQIRLIMPTKSGIQKIKSTQKLAVLRQFFNEDGKVDLKGQGLRISWPLFYKSYIVDIQRHTVNVRDKNGNDGKKDGRYWQDVGIGDDVGLRLKITFSVNEEKESIRKLLKNETAYLSAIRDAAEQIMRLTIKEKYNPENQDTYVDITEIRALQALTNKTKNINDIAVDLEENYGIKLEKVKFSDFDKSEKQKELERDINNQEKIRQNELKNAQNRVDIAEKDKEAQIKKNEGKIDLYKKLKEEIQVSPEQIGKIEGYEKMPKNSILIQSDNENIPISSEILAARKMSDDMEKTEPLEKIKKKEY